MASPSKMPTRMNAKGNLRRLMRSDLPADTVEMARYLIGKVIVHDTAHGRLSGRIVETEAYPVGDEAGHAMRGRTPGNGSLFAERGHAYVYLIYGISFLLNISSEREGVGAGVLLRAIEPLDGVERMRSAGIRIHRDHVGSGPGRLAKAMKVDLRHNGVDLCSEFSSLWLAVTPRKRRAISKTVRIGLTRGAESLLRFYERGNKYVSGPRRLLGDSAK